MGRKIVDEHLRWLEKERARILEKAGRFGMTAGRASLPAATVVERKKAPKQLEAEIGEVIAEEQSADEAQAAGETQARALLRSFAKERADLLKKARKPWYRVW